MKYIKYFLNAPWTLIAIVLAVVSMPLSIFFRRNALVIRINSFWWHPANGLRALALGNIVLLSTHIQSKDLDHELVHIAQHMREPLIHPFLSFIETIKHGSKNSKYENEAYIKAGNTFKED